MNISLDNIEQFSVPLENYIANWIFKDESGKFTIPEHKDQIVALTKEAANFLWNYEMNLGISCTDKFFKTISKFDSSTSDQQIIKKYLYNLGIPFSQKVIISMQPEFGFILTWKMVIKYSQNLFFAHDLFVHDKTLNWGLEFSHDDLFTYGKDFIYDGQQVMTDNVEKLNKALQEMEQRKQL
jgi:hypothetical protein